jgi:ABC-type transport system substrate-binding protein
LSVESRKKTISILNWSDTTSFVVEAEVIRVVITDSVRHSFPFIVGPSMTFALPIAAEGPSVEADENGQGIVYPLGPNLILSWATCSVEVSDHNKIFRCTLKPGYEFPQ